MIKYVSVQEMIAIEKEADRAGHTYARMMAFAGRSLAEQIIIAYSHLGFPKILGLIGTGNNGGDGLVAMAHLLELGWLCEAYLIKPRDHDPLLEAFIQAGGEVYLLDEDPDYEGLRQLVLDCEILLDGILGTGIKLPLRAPVPEVLVVVNSAIDRMIPGPDVVAVDCPSGVDCDTGEADSNCIPADMTVCMAAVKQGLLSLPAFGLLGELVVGDIGLPDNLPGLLALRREVIGEWLVESVIPPRPLDGHKGTFGKALVIAGSKNFSGAVLLAGKAAFRIGAGWVTLCIPSGLHPALVSAFLEATWLPVAGNPWMFDRSVADEVQGSLDRVSAILIGPGFGVSVETQEFLDELISPELPPLVIDADGLKLLANQKNWWEKLPVNSILTPHPGEMSILTGLHVNDIQASRVEIAEKFAAEWGHVVVLKGAFTVVADPGGRSAVLPVATPALGRAGTGDVLAGMICGLRAQGLSPFDAACAGVWLHAQAALQAMEEKGSAAGVLAGDLIETLPSLLPY